LEPFVWGGKWVKLIICGKKANCIEELIKKGGWACNGFLLVLRVDGDVIIFTGLGSW